MTLDEVRAFIAAAPWRFARTMPWNPHYYIVRPDYVKTCSYYPKARSPEEQLFLDVVVFIRKNGENRLFGKRVFREMDIDGHTYWTMGDPLETTWILNRKVIDPAVRRIVVDDYGRAIAGVHRARAEDELNLF